MFSAFLRSIVSGVLPMHHNTSSPPSITTLQLLRAALCPPLKFNLEVVENKPPTGDQLRTILSYIPVATSATGMEARPTSAEGVSKLASQNLHALKWPVVVDWDAGRAAVGDSSGRRETGRCRMKAISRRAGSREST
ncbi:uncharacterized protein B0H18DRAFT_978618, partial [Fomitopsis serialis]|uniref:uncharacterized protein n=1 Tax=Fomitopsis serialis TaxID=139415 RepID=UPI0020081E2E